jgi:hypothetical protein
LARARCCGLETRWLKRRMAGLESRLLAQGAQADTLQGSRHPRCGEALETYAKFVAQERLSVRMPTFCEGRPECL